ncbi:hypothetical protein [Streptomyces europaeiscabiei]|uniref:hypothetical protein n=1 Tax=Streptomyces europaeiscabiei TaxID=146819 RepID=UPI0038F73D2B
MEAALRAAEESLSSLSETVPVHKAMGGDWAEVVHRTDKRGRRRVVRMVYEVVAFQALRDQLKCKAVAPARRPVSGRGRAGRLPTRPAGWRGARGKAAPAHRGAQRGRPPYRVGLSTGSR